MFLKKLTLTKQTKERELVEIDMEERYKEKVKTIKIRRTGRLRGHLRTSIKTLINSNNNQRINFDTQFNHFTNITFNCNININMSSQQLSDKSVISIFNDFKSLLDNSLKTFAL